MNPEAIKLLDKDSKKILFLAGQEVKRYRHVLMRPEHLILASLQEMLPSVARELKRYHLDPGFLERTIRKSLQPGKRSFDLESLLVNPRRGDIRSSKKAAAALSEALLGSQGKPVSPPVILRALLERPSASLRKSLTACKRAPIRPRP